MRARAKVHDIAGHAWLFRACIIVFPLLIYTKNTTKKPSSVLQKKLRCYQVMNTAYFFLSEYILYFLRSYQIMLECWQEHPLDRPGFSQLRKKFSNLLLATTGDTYMELEVDEQKVYYTMVEEEEMVRKDSMSSTDSESSVKKDKRPKKIEKPKWAQNPYVPTPSTFKEDLVHVDDEHYRVQVEVEEDDKEKLADEILPSTDFVATDVEQQAPGSHAPLVGSISVPSGRTPQQTAVLLEDQMGIPLSFISGEKPPPQHTAVQSKKSNPYVDHPLTKQPLASEGELTESSKLGSLSLELSMRMRGGQGENMTSL